MKNKVFYITLGIVLIMHGVGFAGMLYGNRSYYVGLTWVNLLVTGLCFAVASWYEHTHSGRYLLAFLLVCTAGFLAEVAGVKTGYVFGHYTYGYNMGQRLWDVPLVIGLNWGMLVMACGAIAARVYSGLWLRAAVGATLMVLLDLLIEPVAMYLHYWTWEIKMVPLQNFIAWWIVSFTMLAACFALLPSMQNRLGRWIYVVQLVFFTLLNLLML